MTARQPPLVPTGSKEDILVSIHGLEGQGSFRAAKAFLNFSTYLYELVLFFSLERITRQHTHANLSTMHCICIGI